MKAIRQARKAEAVPTLETDIRAMLKRFQSFEQPSILTPDAREQLKKEVQTARGPSTSASNDFGLKIGKGRPQTRDGSGYTARDSGFHVDGRRDGPTSPRGFGWKPQTAMGRLSSSTTVSSNSNSTGGASNSTFSQRASSSSAASGAMPSASVPGPIRAFADVLPPEVPAEPPLHRRDAPQTARGNFGSSEGSSGLSASLSS